MESIISALRNGDNNRLDVNTPEDWKWDCSPEVKKSLETLGIYEAVEENMRIILNARNSHQTSLAIKKIDGLNKVATMIKGVLAVNKDSGSEQVETGIGNIKIDLKREVDAKPRSKHKAK